MIISRRRRGCSKDVNSVIDAQLFWELPFTVTLTYLASVKENVYFSEFNVVPLLVPLKTVEKEDPSVDVAMTKLLVLWFPENHAISTLQMVSVDPKSIRIHEPIPRFDHLVLRLLSSTSFAARCRHYHLQIRCSRGDYYYKFVHEHH